MNIPSKNDCFRLMCETKMLENIVAHSLQVCRVGMSLVDHLRLEGVTLDGKLVQAATLLHDITKTRSFETAENHAQTGGQFLTDLGYVEVGNLVRQHVRLDDYSENRGLSEALIINYADKRVLHDRIVSLDDRMNYILDRYGKNPELQKRIQLLRGKTKDLEKNIFSYLPFEPPDLLRHLPARDILSEISTYRKRCSQLATGSG
jgi:putative nucleotidyltransferase with HDIG domain